MTPITSSVAGLAPVGLTELIDQAALQTRVDRKYVVPLDELPPLLAQLSAYARVLDIDGARAFRYESVYFDTPRLASYHCAAYRRRRRFKVRTRSYLDSAQCWLEVKLSGARGSITKHRLPYRPQDRATVHPGRAFVQEVLEREAVCAPTDSALAPVLVTTYRRVTLLLPATASRVTVDTELTWQDGDRTLRLPDLAVVETKTSRAASPVDRLLWQQGRRPVRISKYATGLAALRPDLPDSPWRRTLRRHFRDNAPPAGTAPFITTPRSEQEASCV
ncbi:polyphosphate polymerase domain-containing protein [Micromonospora fiedleri]|uniref:Polyphosphate polymerase domain-containing protein n=1 Tax=Micromonospora fiedleri TaxID=1157498 RepID=A0ABS1UJR1_9ACTN|nr:MULTISPECIES: polyphosphate polymerase domain-containing protein [Micromonospora]MBL6276592.1 polyphosphate polymerase domain-containing protein [Micromonospora fiedleri]WSK40237.1 polyphosphate polymerase domain-containing protein [Micromonospora maris]